MKKYISSILVALLPLSFVISSPKVEAGGCRRHKNSEKVECKSDDKDCKKESRKSFNL